MSARNAARGLAAAQQAVREFHLAFEHPVADAPAALPRGRAAARCAWMREELEEFDAAGDVVEQADAMVDLIYFALGTLVELGVDAEAAFAVVHAANMEKLGPDGRPLVRADGKIVKPDGWVDPERRLREALLGAAV